MLVVCAFWVLFGVLFLAFGVFWVSSCIIGYFGVFDAVWGGLRVSIVLLMGWMGFMRGLSLVLHLVLASLVFGLVVVEGCLDFEVGFWV